MRIKTKLTLGVGLLFLMILLLGIVGTRYINKLKAETENILVANYNSLDYARQMLIAMEHKSDEAMKQFEINLQKQEDNISEKGEQELTDTLRYYYTQLKGSPTDSALVPSIKNIIYSIMKMNLQAIQRKSELAKQTAITANLWIAITASLCFLIAFILLVNLPSNIANPIKELTYSIRRIADEKYSERVHFEGHSEFGELAASFNRMAEKLEVYNNSNLAKILIEKKRIETLINNMHDPVLGLDENLKVIFANQESLKIFGLSNIPVIGEKIEHLAAHNDLVRLLFQTIKNEKESDATEKTEPIKIFADGKESFFEEEIINISIIPTAETNSMIIGHVIILRNITKYKELDFAKTNFIASVSHEFKTPISSIKMSLQLLDNKRIGELNPEQASLLDSIKNDVDRLLSITGELLKLSQLESGNIQLTPVPESAPDILSDALGSVKTIALQKNIRITSEIPENLPAVLADREKTVWVLINLITNAIRYSDRNTQIRIKLSVESEQVAIRVKDEGSGIAADYRDKIFDRYFRIPGKDSEGSGLGLSICRELIEKQGGRITVESEFGQGSTFCIYLNAINNKFNIRHTVT